MKRKILSLLLACAMVTSVGGTALNAGAVETASKSAVEIHESKSRQGLIDDIYGDFEYSYLDPSMMAGDAAFIDKYIGKSYEVVIPSEIKGIPVVQLSEDSFKDCTILETVTVSEGISYINNAFTGCTNLEKLVIPKSVTKINGTFSDSPNLTIYGYSDSYAENYCIQNNIKFIDLNADEYGFKCENLPDGTRKLLEYKGTSANVVIPNDISIIGEFAFYQCISLTSISIPDSVTSIGDAAFAYCTNLTSISIPNSVTSIEDYTFFRCTSLKEVNITNGVTSIGSVAFEGCTNLTNVTIPNSVTYIKPGAFRDCKNITSIHIPDGVSKIDNCTFESCTGLKNVYIPESVTSINYYAFYGCESLENIYIPNSVTSLDKESFTECENLTIYGEVGSAAETYANENNIPFVDIETLSIEELYTLNLSIKGKTSESSGSSLIVKSSNAATEYIATYDPETDKFVFDYTPKANEHIVITVKSKITDKVVKTYEYTFKNSDIVKGANSLAVAVSKNTIKDDDGKEIVDLDLNVESIVVDKDTDSEIDTDSDKDTDSEVDTASDKDTDSEVDTASDKDTDSEVNTDSDKNTDSDTDKDKTPDTANLKYGDLDNDRKITSADALLVLRASVKLETFDTAKTKLADVDGDKRITSSDSLAILRYSVGFRDEGILIK